MNFSLSTLRFVTVWFSMAVAMSANGIFRELALKRVVGLSTANVISAAMGVVLIAFITRVGFRPLGRITPTTSLLLLSAVLVVLTVAFETAMGRFVDHKPWGDIGAHYALWRGELWPLVLLFLALTPFVWARWTSART